MTNHPFPLLAACFVASLIANATFADVVTFESNEGFTIGDGIAEINSVTQALGVEVRSVANELPQAPFLLVSTDPNDGGNQVLSSSTNPMGADILFNFSAKISYVRVEFVDNPFGANIPVTLFAYDTTGTALEIQSLPLLGSDTGFEPDFLEFAHPNIRAVQVESNGNRIYIDNLQFSTVPEPRHFSLGIAILGGLLIRRKRS